MGMYPLKPKERKTITLSCRQVSDKVPKSDQSLKVTAYLNIAVLVPSIPGLNITRNVIHPQKLISAMYRTARS